MLFELLFRDRHQQIKQSWISDNKDFYLSLEYFSLSLFFYFLSYLIGVIESKQNPNTRYTMEQARFALGRARKETKQEKKKRLREKRHCKRKPLKQRIIKEFKTKRWVILPTHLTKEYSFWLHMLKGDTFFEKRKTLLDEMEKIKLPKESVLGFDTSSGERFRKELLVKSQYVMSFLHQNQKLRWIFKKFFTRLRIRRFKKVNETDPITMEICNQPVYIHSFPSRKTYMFEAETISKEISNKLKNNDGHIPSPVYPRNPLTNQEFTLCETIAILEQCKEYGKVSWAIEAFKASRYDLISFAAVHSKPLRLEALHATMSNLTSWDCTDTLFDFIRDQYSIHNLQFHSSLYDWSVRQIIQHPLMEQWRKFCMKWYETDIIIEDESIKLRFFVEIQKRTFLLCKRFHELQVVRTALIKRRQEIEDGSSSAGHTTSQG